VEGRNLTFEMRFGDGHELASLATELTALHLDLIQAVARPGVMACTPRRRQSRSLRSISRATPSCLDS
jgi:hypothetical protein